jgi:hypothetical protein
LELTKEFARPAGIMSFAGFLHWKLFFHHQKKPVSKYKSTQNRLILFRMTLTAAAIRNTH